MVVEGYCKQCHAKRWGGYEGHDFEGLCGPGQIADVICDGCGPTIVDETGRCIHTCQLNHAMDECEGQLELPLDETTD